MVKINNKIIVFSILLITSTLLNTPLTYSETPDTTTNMERGVTLYEKGDLIGAAREFEQAIYDEPSNTSAYEYLTEICNKSEELDFLYPIIKKISDLYPENTEFKTMLADLFIRMAIREYSFIMEKKELEPDQGLKFKGLLSLYQNDPESLFYLGLLSMGDGDIEDALKVFREAYELDPSYGSERFLKRGMSLENNGMYEEAIRVYEIAIMLDPHYPPVRFQRGVILYNLERYEDALMDFSAISEEYKTAETYFYLGNIYDKLSRVVEAIVALEKSTQEDDDSFESHLLLARLLNKSEDYIGSIKEYESAMKLIPDHMEASKELEELKKRNYPTILVDIGNEKPYALIVEKSSQTTYLYGQEEDGEMVRIKGFATTTGKVNGNKWELGDNKTPEGVYFFTTVFTDEQLPEKYGIMALPMNYPNALDLRLGKSGAGIWMHGVKKEDEMRPPYNSRGCIVCKNDDIIELSQHIKLKRTPIIVVEEMRYQDKETNFKERGNIHEFIEDWRKSWEGKDLDQYMTAYSTIFKAGKRDFESWKRYKARLNAKKKYIKVKLSDINVLKYGSSTKLGDITVVSFVQNYQSDDFSDVGLKMLFLRDEGDRPKIIAEVCEPFREESLPDFTVGAGR